MRYPGYLVLAVLGALSVLPVRDVAAGGFNSSQIQQSNELDKDLPKNPDFDYLRVDPIMLPENPDKGQTRPIMVIVTLELPLGTKDDARQFLPHLNDAYLQNIYQALKSDHPPRDKNEVDVQALTKLLTGVTDGIMGEGAVHQVMIKVQTVLK
jgi:hypothetical protein